jgi:hypothetical protein
MFLIWSPRGHYFLGFCWRQLTTGDYQPCLVIICRRCGAEIVDCICRAVASVILRAGSEEARSRLQGNRLHRGADHCVCSWPEAGVATLVLAHPQLR